MQKGNFEAKENSSIITRFEELVEKVKAGDTQIADARNSKHFNGEEPEPTAGMNINMYYVKAISKF